jgi:hypothetical protein
MNTNLWGRRCASFVALIVLGVGGATVLTTTSIRADTAVVTADKGNIPGVPR